MKSSFTSECIEAARQTFDESRSIDILYRLTSLRLLMGDYEGEPFLYQHAARTVLDSEVQYSDHHVSGGIIAAEPFEVHDGRWVRVPFQRGSGYFSAVTATSMQQGCLEGGGVSLLIDNLHNFHINGDRAVQTGFLVGRAVACSYLDGLPQEHGEFLAPRLSM
jgi:hypothetical protein